MLTPMTPEELKRHRSMGLYKTQADMEADDRRLRAIGMNTASSKCKTVGLTSSDTHPVVGLSVEPTFVDPLDNVEIQEHDD